MLSEAGIEAAGALDMHTGRKPVRTAAAAVAFGCVLLLSGAWPAHAQTYVSLGYGGISCANWSSRKAIEGKAYEAWMLGFISSYNAYVFSGSNVVDGIEVDDLRKWVDEYCKDHEQENFDAVVRLLIEEHAKKSSASTR
jgi:hypothetical protein